MRRGNCGSGNLSGIDRLCRDQEGIPFHGRRQRRIFPWIRSTGRSRLSLGSGNQVVVTATLKSDNVEVDQQQNGNRIEIASHLLQGANEQAGQVDYELLIPPGATLNLHSSTGPLSAEHLRGDLTLEGTDAAVNVRNVGNGHVHVRTMRGPITLTDVLNGHVEIASISGDVHLKSVDRAAGAGEFRPRKDFLRWRFRFRRQLSVHHPHRRYRGPGAGECLGRFQSALGTGPGATRLPLQPKHSRFPTEAGRSFVGTVRRGRIGSRAALFQW